eukprot:scaffold63054_cov60-Phaeocystis_antarctica.AAC.3
MAVAGPRAAGLKAAASSSLRKRVAQAGIVLAPPLWAAQHLICLVDLAKALGAAVRLVWVVHPGQATIGRLYIVLRRLARDGEGVVVISCGGDEEQEHEGTSHGRPARRRLVLRKVGRGGRSRGAARAPLSSG